MFPLQLIHLENALISFAHIFLCFDVVIDNLTLNEESLLMSSLIKHCWL